jgi:hypothetical protein
VFRLIQSIYQSFRTSYSKSLKTLRFPIIIWKALDYQSVTQPYSQPSVMLSTQQQQLLNTATTNPTNREAIAYPVKLRDRPLDSQQTTKGIPLIMSDRQITSTDQTTAKNASWVNVTVTVNYDDGSTKQTSSIQPKVRG